ncbi:hypothetical protein NDU88_006081 [Pleurodeles waltl]|uniref:Uncharacterized protein n=1 Tax=Pleurodeles waltl TaxID=8319 RepID=A0AAV7LN04_PLEWA|nr:hypothetical protein NDU88_006081 [Pleurodeles waltl]
MVRAPCIVTQHQRAAYLPLTAHSDTLQKEGCARPLHQAQHGDTALQTQCLWRPCGELPCVASLSQAGQREDPGRWPPQCQSTRRSGAR